MGGFSPPTGEGPSTPPRPAALRASWRSPKPLKGPAPPSVYLHGGRGGARLAPESHPGLQSYLHGTAASPFGLLGLLAGASSARSRTPGAATTAAWGGGSASPPHWGSKGGLKEQFPVQWRGVSILQEKWCSASWASGKGAAEERGSEPPWPHIAPPAARPLSLPPPTQNPSRVESSLSCPEADSKQVKLGRKPN